MKYSKGKNMWRYLLFQNFVSVHEVTGLLTISGLNFPGRQRNFLQDISSTQRWNQEKSKSRMDVDEVLKEWEIEVASNVQSQLDENDVNRAIKAALSEKPASNFYKYATSPQWAISLAAGVSCGLVVIFLTQSIAAGLISLVCVGFVANRDPIEEQDTAGALARIVGRFTIASVPKAKAVARVALTGEEDLAALQLKLDSAEEVLKVLEEKNQALLLWKKRRLWVDEVLPRYNLQELKETARRHKQVVGGTKAQLLMRLVEAEIILPDFDEKASY